ncbi:MAG: ELKS/Rab6-interacting/CAST family protein [Bacteroidales bacterium]|nr:ELKS/Rab6-interacting/CAST family protein [Bacteroidales bacterium]
MKSNLFFGCTSIDEVQLRFDELSNVFNDQDEMLKAIKEEYSTLMSVLHDSKPVYEAVKERATVSDKIKELQEKVNPEGLSLEICGTWLWVTGKTYQVKNILKELGFRYSANKLSWYYRQSNHRSANQKPVPLAMIREKYGTNVVAIV